MKRKVLVLTTMALSLSFGSMVYAHCGKCGVGDEKPTEGKMTEALDLTPEQATQIDAIKKEKHEKIKGIHEETREKIKAVLTDQQKAKFDGMHQYGEGHGHVMKCGPECKNGCTDECKMKKKMNCGPECKDGCTDECKMKKKSKKKMKKNQK